MGGGRNGRTRIEPTRACQMRRPRHPSNPCRAVGAPAPRRLETCTPACPDDNQKRDKQRRGQAVAWPCETRSTGKVRSSRRPRRTSVKPRVERACCAPASLRRPDPYGGAMLLGNTVRTNPAATWGNGGDRTGGAASRCARTVTRCTDRFPRSEGAKTADPPLTLRMRR